jgi:hypothetical protein
LQTFQAAALDALFLVEEDDLKRHLRMEAA